MEDKERYENAKKQIKLTHPALPMINLVQPVVACKLYGNEFLNENGVTARFVPFFHHCTNFSRHELNMDDGLTAYKSKVTSLLQLFHHRLHICKYFFYMIKHIVPPLR